MTTHRRIAVPRASILLGGIAWLGIAACSGPPPSADQRRASEDELNQSGRPYDGPAGVVSSTPPADNNAARLLCHPEGPGISCSRPGE